VHDVKPCPAEPGTADVQVAQRCSVCRGDFGGGGPDGVADEVLAGGGGDNQGGDGSAVDGAGAWWIQALRRR